MPHCYAYFSLLRRAVESVADGQADLQFLRAVLGFECASVSWEGRTAPLAVLTSTAKNPVYLLSKLGQPKAYEDPKFLPLSTVFDPMSDPGDRTPLFYHYRQLSPGARGEFRLLVCPTVETKARLDAFACLQSLEAAFANKRDTRVHQRSIRITDLAVGPVLERLLAPLDCCSEPEIRIADLGAGSGDSTRGVLQQVVGRFPQVVRGRRFSWTMVDLAFADPGRHAFSRSFSRRLAELRCQRADYASWIQQQSSSTEGKLYHVVLLYRLLNNASVFSIGWVDDWHQVRKLARRALGFHAWREGAYLPHIALRCHGLRAPGLLASNGRVPLVNGSTFCQLSLSDYFRGLHLLTEKPLPAGIRPEAVFFPIRRFDQSALELPGGESILERLCSLSFAVIIENVDLNARVLRRHLASCQLDSLAASDATDRSRLHAANLLCVATKRDGAILPGRRIW